MKKFVILTVGFTKPTPDMMNAWMEWFRSIQNKMVEQVGFGMGKEITKEGVKDLSMDQDAITGYMVIHAANMEEAMEISNGCPMITATRVYEIR